MKYKWFMFNKRTDKAIVISMGLYKGNNNQ